MNMNQKYLRVGVIIAALLLAGLYNVITHPWMLDDAYISFRYAENLASGNGPVFNPGEKVEGYTTFLWIVLLALGKRLGAELTLLSKLLGIAFAAGTLLLLANARHFIRYLDERTPLRAVLFLATCAAFSPWAMTGMEVTLFTFEVTFLILYYFLLKESSAGRWRWAALGLAAALTAMTRPEGILVFGLIFLDIAVGWLRTRNGIRLYSLFSFSLIYIPYSLWRLTYYGYLFPNTFYVKVGFGWEQALRGFHYLSAFLIPAALLVFLFLNFSMALPGFHPYKKLYLIPALIGTYTLYIVSVGGDVWAAFRFFTPLLPLLCLSAALSLEMFVQKKMIGRTAVIILSVLAIAWNVFQFRANDVFYPKIKRDQAAGRGVLVGLWLRIHSRPDALLATNTAGSIPYVSRLKTIDMLGLNDLHIAHKKITRIGQGLAGHEKGDGAYVLSKMPDYIHLGPALGSALPWPGFVGDREIYENPEFHRLYRLEKVALKSGETLFIYKRLRQGTANE